MTIRKYILVLFSVFAVCFSVLLAPASAATISGTVTDSNGPVAGVIIRLILTSSYPSGGVPTYYVTSPETESDGGFIFSSLPHGDYIVSVPVNWDETPYYQQGTMVSVAEDEDLHFDIQLELASTISGTIRRADGGMLTAEELDSIQITLYTSLEFACNYTFSNVFYLSGIRYVSTISADGSYSITGLPPGDYYVAARGNGTVNYIPEWSTGATSVNQCSFINSSVEILSPGSQVNSINFQLNNGSAVQGTVYHNPQKPADELRVRLAINNTVFSETPCDLASSSFALSVDLDENGAYHVTGLPAGDYSLFALSKTSDPSVNKEWLTGINTDSSPNCQQAERLIVTSAEPEQVFDQRNFQVGTGGSISGTVFQADGQTPADDTYLVRFQKSCATVGDEPEVTSVSGQYTSPVLPAGDYSLALLNEAGEFVGWRTASGALSVDCANAVAVHVDEDQTATGVDFIVKERMILTPIYHMLLYDHSL